ncbi:MAG: ABC transporter ATP-binding protein [Clostridiales bacterium]|nr:ABC transporter ATP-binding protein [Clostridiales bacterium]
MDKAKIEVRGLTKRFGDLLVLDNISFDVHPGEFLSIVGPTGCGKTTLLNILSNWWQPSAGQIRIDGQPMDPQTQNLAFVFQESSAFPWLTVEQNIQFGMKEKNFPSSLIAERTEEVIHMLGLADARKKYCHEISASMEQRVVIGRSFALHPDLLLMDEPYAQLDIKFRFHLEDAILKLSRDTNSTLIFVTHNIEEAVYLSERCIVLTNKPTSIKEIRTIDLPYPRDICSSAFVAVKDEITEMIKWW